MAYSPPSANITSGVNFFSWLNSTIDNWFFPGVLLAAYFIIFVKLLYSTNKIGQAFVSSSFICLILSVLLRVADLVSNVFMVMFIILTAIGVVWVNVEDAKFS